jgi:hypothetical protein
LKGSILDIGGGGEAVIWQVYGDRVTASRVVNTELLLPNRWDDGYEIVLLMDQTK